MNGLSLALLLPLSAIIIQGAHTAVARMSVGYITPESISFYRWAIAVVMLAPIMGPSFIREWPLIRQNLLRIAILGVLGMVAYQVAVYFAVQTTTATNAAILGSLAPLLTVGFSVVLLKERPGPLVLTGCIISFIGVLLLIEHGDLTAILTHRIVMGDILVLAGVTLYALYSTLLRHWKMPLSALALFYAQALTAFVVLTPWPFIGTFSPIDASNWPLVAMAAIGGSFAAPLLWMLAVRRVGAVVTAIFSNLSPLVTIGIAVTWMGEHVELYHIIGGLLTLGGVILAQAELLRRAPKPATV